MKVEIKVKVEAIMKIKVKEVLDMDKDVTLDKEYYAIDVFPVGDTTVACIVNDKQEMQELDLSQCEILEKFTI